MGDVGLKEENADDDRGHGLFGLSQLNRIARWAQPITYVDIFECENFTVSPMHPFSQTGLVHSLFSNQKVGFTGFSILISREMFLAIGFWFYDIHC